MSMGDTVLAYRSQEDSNQLSMSPLRNDEEGCATGCRLQHICRITLHNPTVDSKVRVFGALSGDDLAEHLLSTRIRIELGGEGRGPG